MFFIVTVQCSGGKKFSNACYRIMCVTLGSQAGFHATGYCIYLESSSCSLTPMEQQPQLYR